MPAASCKIRNTSSFVIAFSLSEWNWTLNPEPQPVIKPSLPAAAALGFSATWLGHASWLLQVGFTRILLDPVLSYSIAPCECLGVNRYTAAPCTVDELPSVDIVCISHAHYDHCDAPFIKKLHVKSKKDGHTTKWVVPLRLGSLLTSSCGIPASQVVEMDWWQATSLDSTASPVQLPEGWNRYKTEHSLPRSQLQGSPSYQDLQRSVQSDAYSHPELPPCIVCIPAQHNAARTPFDRNMTLWAGYAIISPQGRILFTGDTGYRFAPHGVLPDTPEEDALRCCPTFREVGDRLGPFDIGLLPIGAYSPRSFMSSIHVSPEDAVEIHLDTRCRQSVGMHWGTMPLTDEPSTEPPARLASALQRRGLSQDVFTKLKLGGTLGRRGPMYPSHLWTMAATQGDNGAPKHSHSISLPSSSQALPPSSSQTPPPSRAEAARTNSGTQQPTGAIQVQQRHLSAPVHTSIAEETNCAPCGSPVAVDRGASAPAAAPSGPVQVGGSSDELAHSGSHFPTAAAGCTPDAEVEALPAAGRHSEAKETGAAKC